MAKLRVKEREARHCTECGKQLRKFWKRNENVCGQPKVTKTQSRCQLDRSARLKTNNQARNTDGRECKICGDVMVYKANSNQEICNRPKNIRYLFLEPKTPCQIKNQKSVESDWKKKRKENPVERTEEEQIEDIIDQIWLPELKLPPNDGKMRMCLGMLSDEDQLGAHWFKSAGPGNRICPLCVEAKETRSATGSVRDEAPNKRVASKARYNE
jgi:hypothetical protein